MGLRREAETEVQSVEAQRQHERPPVVAVGDVGRTVERSEDEIHLGGVQGPDICLFHLTVSEGLLLAPEPQQERVAAADVNDENPTNGRVLQDSETEDVVNV